MLLSKILIEATEKGPQNLAVLCGEKKFTYAEFKTRVFQFANSLTNLGINRQDRVAIIHKNCHYYLESYFACASIGAVLVPINYRFSPQDFIYILNNSDARIVISHPEFANIILAIRDKVPQIGSYIWTEKQSGLRTENDHYFYEQLIQHTSFKEPVLSKFNQNSMAQIYYTSGTTGKPKGVVLTHKNNYEHARGTIEELNLSNHDRWLHVSPMFHLADAWAVWAITQAGGVHVLVPEFNPENVLRTIEVSSVTVSNLIPTMLNILVNCPADTHYNLSSFRLVMSGGAPIAPEVVRKTINMFQCEYIQTYGMTETSPFLTMSILKPHLRRLPFEERLKYSITTGRAFVTVDLKVINEKGNCIASNDREVGEIVVKGDTITSCYWKLPEETAMRIVDGWLYTGDLATLNHEGYVTIVDRKNDMIITGGENVYSIEVENVLYSHPAILEAAVIGVPDEILGEKIKAVVVLKQSHEAADNEIIDYCKKHLAHFKTPKCIKFVEELPKTGSKKISKHRLRLDEGNAKETGIV